MTKTPTSWIDVTTSHLRLNPGKSLMNIMPAAKAEWKKIKAGLHPSKMVGPPKKHKKHSSKHKKQHGGKGCSSNAEVVGKGVDSANGADEPQPYVNGNELDGAEVGQVGAGGKSKKHKRHSKRNSNNNRNKTKKHKRNSKRNSKHNRSKKH